MFSFFCFQDTILKILPHPTPSLVIGFFKNLFDAIYPNTYLMKHNKDIVVDFATCDTLLLRQLAGTHTNQDRMTDSHSSCTLINYLLASTDGKISVLTLHDMQPMTQQIVRYYFIFAGTCLAFLDRAQLSSGEKRFMAVPHE